jgi:hypothetical protein
MEASFLPPVSAGLFWCLVFDVCPREKRVDRESGSEVNLSIDGVCGERLPTVDFPHVDLP